MNTREQLNQYLRGLESRLRMQVVSKGIAVALGVALGATVALVLITNAFAFSTTSLVIARITLFLSLAFALGLALVMPLIKLNQRRAAGRAETVFPDFQERLVTYVERRDDGPDPFVDILAADTLKHAPQAPPSSIVTPKSLFAFATSAGAAGAVLLWLILAGPGFLGYGASMLWAGPPKDPNMVGGFYRITVDPGDKLVRRRSDMAIRATLVGFQAPEVRLMARYKSSAKWEQANMLPRASDSSYEYLFAAVPEPVEYYVEAAGVKSKTYKLDVIDLAGVKNIKVTYHYPSWLGKKDEVENPGGDLRAVVKTVAELEVETDRPLKNGLIELNDGTKIDLEAKQGNILIAKVPIEKDGAYHFAAAEGGENVRITQDYFIEAKVDEAPSVKITHPGADAKVSPIEEVTVTVTGADDFALQAMDLHYSVNGQAEKVIPLLTAKGAPTGEGKVVLSLEDFKLVPGDIVSMYATASDARSKTVGDITFIEAQPYERNFSQSQQGGGGGGGGGGGQQNDPSQITQREKEIIAATHNFNRGGKDAQANAENAQYLSEVQAKLKEQAESMAKRTTARELSTENQDFQSFTKEMEAAAAEMGPASDKLKGQKWSDALEPENKALQHLSRAMATFRDIQVARGQGGGGGGGGQDAGRDLANLFDLELDTEKNQYESQQSSSGDKQQQAIDDAMQKLEQLARRQQQLAQQGQNKQQANVDRRWEQEQLRREAEELRKQLQQMQQQQGQQSQQGQLSRNSQSSQSGQSSSQSKGGQQSASSRQSQQQIQQMMDRLQQAQDDMRASQQAQQKGDQAQADASAKRAAERMQEARDMADRMKRQDTAGQLGDLQERADHLAEHQKEVENQLRQSYGGNSKDGKGGNGLNRQQSEQVASELDKNLEDLKKLEQDIQRSARDLRSTQPDASTRLRDGVGEIQQNDVERRMQYSSEYIRNGRGDQVNQSGWLPPVNRAMDTMREGIRQAQQALSDGTKEGAGKNERDQQLAQVESLRRQIEQFSRGQQNGQQKGQQPGGQQPGQAQGKGQQPGQGQGKGGQQPGQQPGQGQTGGGNQNGGNQFGGGGPNGGAYFGGQFGRWNPQGYYDLPDGRRVEPSQVVRDYARDLNDLRQRFKDDPEMSKQIADVERALTQANVGDTSGPELQERLSRTVLPQLETLEVQMRQKLGEETGGQVRSAGTERMPDGFREAVSEYFRQLGSGKKQ
ncbi:MAG TPA: hypothetical protein VGQ49_01715 [Bryobacteraceae bacterium]|jgi:hypothetical protein|nr:hypothetical protein [Bryobacteraceae bacterium]